MTSTAILFPLSSETWNRPVFVDLIFKYKEILAAMICLYFSTWFCSHMVERQNCNTKKNNEFAYLNNSNIQKHVQIQTGP